MHIVLNFGKRFASDSDTNCLYCRQQQTEGIPFRSVILTWLQFSQLLPTTQRHPTFCLSDRIGAPNWWWMVIYEIVRNKKREKKRIFHNLLGPTTSRRNATRTRNYQTIILSSDCHHRRRVARLRVSCVDERLRQGAKKNTDSYYARYNFPPSIESLLLRFAHMQLS